MDALTRIPLRRTGTSVNRLILGLGPLGNLYRAISEEQAQATLQEWWDRGLRTFDVAPLYGMGIAERRLGRFLAGKPRSEACISTKVGRPVVQGTLGSQATARPGGSTLYVDTPPGAYAIFAFDRETILRSLDDSRARLGVDRVDYVHTHDPDNHLAEACDVAFPVLARLRDEGMIGAIGTGVNSSRVGSAMVSACDLDCVMIAGRYSLLDQEALGTLLPLCATRGVPVLAAGVLNSGFLADPRPGNTYQYQPCWDSGLIDRATRIRAVCERQSVPITAAAVQFPLGHPAVKAAVVGAGSPAHAAALADSFAWPIGPDLWKELLVEGLLPPDTPVPVETT